MENTPFAAKVSKIVVLGISDIYAFLFYILFDKNIKSIVNF
jgi:hypothetical protein